MVAGSPATGGGEKLNKHEKSRQVEGVRFSKKDLFVSLRDGETISVPLAWYPRLLNATAKQRQNWQIAGGGYGIHWPDIDEDLNTEGLLRGAPAPRIASKKSRNKHKNRPQS